MIRVLGLGPQEWSWKNASDDLKQLQAPENGLPVVALAFGGTVAQKITGERDALPQLRETILALSNGSDEEIPVIASFDLAQLIAKPKDKALLWQDLLVIFSLVLRVTLNHKPHDEANSKTKANDDVWYGHIKPDQQ